MCIERASFMFSMEELAMLFEALEFFEDSVGGEFTDTDQLIFDSIVAELEKRKL